jgi:hypothetical protein
MRGSGGFGHFDGGDKEFASVNVTLKAFTAKVTSPEVPPFDSFVFGEAFVAESGEALNTFEVLGVEDTKVWLVHSRRARRLR